MGGCRCQKRLKNTPIYCTANQPLIAKWPRPQLGHRLDRDPDHAQVFGRHRAGLAMGASELDEMPLQVQHWHCTRY